MIEEENLTFTTINRQLTVITTSEESSQPKPEAKTPQSNEARDVIPLTDAANASVSQTLSCRARPARQGTEATSQHGIPDLQPLTPQLTANTTPASDQHQLAQSTTGKPRDIPSTKSTGDQQCPVNSTLSVDLGLPMQCNICDREISSKNVLQHCQTNHNFERPSINQHATMVSLKPDSIYRNYGKLKPGAMMVTEEGEYLTLEKPTSMGWNTINIHTKEKKNLELVKDMAGMRYTGQLSQRKCIRGIHP